MGGSQFAPNIDAGYLGVYYTVGVPAIGTNPPSLVNTSSWIDSSGNLWLFGGIAEDTTGAGYWVNDMWEFNPSINEWTFTSANSGDADGGSNLGIYGTPGN